MESAGTIRPTQGSPPTTGVLIRYWAGAKKAAGREQEWVYSGSVGQILDGLKASHGAVFAGVLGSASILVDGQVLHDLTTMVLEGSTLEILPPFAGG